jgi:quercetin dioxygenase-like cupin family protein
LSRQCRRLGKNSSSVKHKPDKKKLKNLQQHFCKACFFGSTYQHVHRWSCSHHSGSKGLKPCSLPRSNSAQSRHVICQIFVSGDITMPYAKTLNQPMPAAKLAASSFLLAAAAALLSSTAHAGECPAGKAGANSLANAPAAPVGITDTELASIDLAKENVKLNQRRLRMRHMTIAPGGVVPLHDHADRPALIMVNSGEIYENSSKCQVPILHKAGDIAREYLGTRHHWKNETSQPVELTIADIVNDEKPATMPKHM